MNWNKEIGPDADHWINYGRIWGPKWRDGCNHGANTYIATFEVCESPKTGLEIIDLYCFENGERQEFCLRYGPSDSEYYSPGDVVGIIQSSQHSNCYRSALGILRSLGTIKWELAQ